jgi:hypothetical protein
MQNQIIDIATALRMMNDTYDYDKDQVKTYGLKYYVPSGERHERFNCRKNVRHPKQRADESLTRRGKSDKRFAGVVQIFDHDTSEIRDIPVSQIVYFRMYQSTQWLKIKN